MRRNTMRVVLATLLVTFVVLLAAPGGASAAVDNSYRGYARTPQATTAWAWYAGYGWYARTIQSGSTVWVQPFSGSWMWTWSQSAGWLAVQASQLSTGTSGGGPTTGTVSGAVTWTICSGIYGFNCETDPLGGASVTFTKVGTTTSSSVTADAGGRYTATLTPGTWRVVAATWPWSATGTVTVTAGQNATLNLDVGAGSDPDVITF